MTRVFFALLSALTIFLLAGAPATVALAAEGGTAVASLDPRAEDEGTAAAKVAGEVDVDVDRDRGGEAWYLSPTWIVIGILAVGVLVAIIVAASRGGGTTVIRD
jgi:hypothetical protein